MIVTTNMNGDILSDLSSALIGELGFAPSANVGNEVAIFEAVHGSAPKYAGKNVINPTAVILSSVLMLRYLGFFEQAAAIEHAVFVTLESGVLTGDVLGYDRGTPTTDYTNAIIGNLGKRTETWTIREVKPLQLPKIDPRPDYVRPASRSVVGLDVFVESPLSAAELGSSLMELTHDTKLSLKMISSRGTKVFPPTGAMTETGDHFRCRFIIKEEPGDLRTRTSTRSWCGSRARTRGCTSRSCRSSTASSASPGTRARTSRTLRTWIEDQGRDRRLREVELGRQIAEDRHGLSNGRSRVGPAQGRRVQALPAQETILDEPQVGVERQGLVIDQSRADPRADRKTGDADPEPVLVDTGRMDVVVEAAPVVPRQVEHARLPLRAPHQGVDDLGHPGLTRPDVARRMLARADERHDPGHRRERPRRRGLEIVGVWPDVAELMVRAPRCGTRRSGAAWTWCGGPPPSGTGGGCRSSHPRSRPRTHRARGAGT